MTYTWSKSAWYEKESPVRWGGDQSRSTLPGWLFVSLHSQICFCLLPSSHLFFSFFLIPSDKTSSPAPLSRHVFPLVLCSYFNRESFRWCHIWGSFLESVELLEQELRKVQDFIILSGPFLFLCSLILKKDLCFCLWLVLLISLFFSKLLHLASQFICSFISFFVSDQTLCLFFSDLICVICASFKVSCVGEPFCILSSFKVLELVFFLFLLINWI